MKNLKDSKLIICSIVKDAACGLKNNIPIIDAICEHAKDYHIIIFENNSKDNTKEVLYDWKKRHADKMYLSAKDVVIKKETKPNDLHRAYLTVQRLNKMASLRNQYMDYIDNNHLEADYLMVVDLDVVKIDLNGVLGCFESSVQWDAVTAFGYSTSPRFFKTRYHDSFALIENGRENDTQTMRDLVELSDKYGNLKPTDPWIRVYSAFGGMSIIRFDAVKGLKYQVEENGDAQIEAKCEHYTLYKQMRLRGFDKVYINPALRIFYQRLTWTIIYRSGKKMLYKLFFGKKSLG